MKINDSLYPQGYIVMPLPAYDNMTNFINVQSNDIRTHEQSIKELHDQVDSLRAEINKRDLVIFKFAQLKARCSYDADGIYNFEIKELTEMGVSKEILETLNIWAKEQYKKEHEEKECE